MALIKSISKFVRGESETEYLQRKAATSRIRSIERAATFKARQQEALKFAETRERLMREAKEKKLKARLNPQRRPSANLPSLRNSPFGGTGFGFGGYAAQTRTVRRPKKSSKRTRIVTRYVNAPEPRKFDVLGL